ncbi:MAG: nucleoside hydrolase [Planctomycetota bacterium]
MTVRSLCFVIAITYCPFLIAAPPQPIPVIFDTDLGNDCDDVLALGMIHALQSRGQCELLAVTITKDHRLAAPFADAVNTFYGRGDIPIGVCRSGVTTHAGKYNTLAEQTDGDSLRYPHDLLDGGEAEDAVTLLRRTLASQDDGSVRMIQVGFSTNLAKLLDSPADSDCDLDGRALVAAKVHSLSIMAGAFEPISRNGAKPTAHREYNVIKDISSAQTICKKWPTPITWSGFEIGIALPYPHQSILNDYQYVNHHPLADAYTLYHPPPHNRPTWDLTSVLVAVFPENGYFEHSPLGRVQIDADGYSTFAPQADGRDRYLILADDASDRVMEALVLLSSQPPSRRK